MYTPIIALADLENYIYPEKITAITRSNATIVNDAIASAISEVKTFLGRFDIVAMFGDPVADTAATMPADQFLNKLCAHIACWNIVQLANVGIDLSLIRTNQEDAIHTLTRIQQLKQVPQNWPLLDLNTINTNATKGNPVQIKARPKRSNNF